MEGQWYQRFELFDARADLNILMSVSKDLLWDNRKYSILISFDLECLTDRTFDLMTAVFKETLYVGPLPCWLHNLQRDQHVMNQTLTMTFFERLPGPRSSIDKHLVHFLQPSDESRLLTQKQFCCTGGTQSA